MNPHVDTLFRVLKAADVVKFALCDRHTLSKYPISKLCYTMFPTVNPGRVRRMKLHEVANLPDTLTHVILVRSGPSLHFGENLVYLAMHECLHNLTLPPNLHTFIGFDITNDLLLSQSLTHLELDRKPRRIVGLDKHPNLTILRFGYRYTFGMFDSYDPPPKLVEMETAQFPICQMPQTLRILRIVELFTDTGVPFIPDTLEEFDFQVSRQLTMLPKLPHTLRSLALFSFHNISHEQVSECSKLAKVVMHSHIDYRHMRDSLCNIANFIPQVTDLSFHSNRASSALKNLPFNNLRYLRIGFGYMYQDETLALGHLTTLAFLEITYAFLEHCSCKMELPPFLRRLTLLRAGAYFEDSTNRFSIELPASVKVLHVDSFHRHVFDIGIAREHLANLEVIGDRGTIEHDSRIVTEWGQFVLN